MVAAATGKSPRRPGVQPLTLCCGGKSSRYVFFLMFLLCAHSTPPRTYPQGKYAIREGGIERRVSAAEAFLLHVTKLGLEGDGLAARTAMAAIQEVRTSYGAGQDEDMQIIVRWMAASGSVSSALTALRMATKLDPYRPTARIKLEPWLVEQALARLEARRLSREEQVKVVKVTWTPRKVKWPEWGRSPGEGRRKIIVMASFGEVSEPVV